MYIYIYLSTYDLHIEPCGTTCVICNIHMYTYSYLFIHIHTNSYIFIHIQFVPFCVLNVTYISWHVHEYVDADFTVDIQ